MLIAIQGNLLEVKRGIITHGVNCQGMMGAGIAHAFARRWPVEVFAPYKKACDEAGAKRVGGELELLGWVQTLPIAKDLWVANSFTQPYGGNCASYDAIAKCFETLVVDARIMKLPVCFPLIGCGIGGLKWPIVQSIIEETALDVEFRLYVLPE